MGWSSSPCIVSVYATTLLWPHLISSLGVCRAVGCKGSRGYSSPWNKTRDYGTNLRMRVSVKTLVGSSPQGLCRGGPSGLMTTAMSVCTRNTLLTFSVLLFFASRGWAQYPLKLWWEKHAIYSQHALVPCDWETKGSNLGEMSLCRAMVLILCGCKNYIASGSQLSSNANDCHLRSWIRVTLPGP